MKICCGAAELHAVHPVSLIRNPLIRNSPEDSWKNRKWNPEPFEPKVQNKK